MSERLHQVVDDVLAMPGLRQWHQKRHDAAFQNGHYGGTCRGVYKTFDEAAAAAPKTLPLGYDHDGPAAMYRDRLERVYPSDYAMMHWLERAFDDGAVRVFDLGGHVGVSYYAYQKYLNFPDGLAWQIFEVPSVIKAGREIASARDHRRALAFVEQFDLAGDAEVLFTSGCVQYLEQSLAEKLTVLSRRPQWVLVNLLPLHDQREYWTVQSIGSAFCPYRIQRKSTFLADLDRLGYQVLDIWENPEKRCEIAFEPDFSLEGYFGVALKLK